MLGKNIKYYRIKGKYTQESLAKLLKVSKHTISAWECGRQHPDRKYIDQLLNIFLVPEYELYCRMDVHDSLSTAIDRLYKLDEHLQFEVISLISRLWAQSK